MKTLTILFVIFTSFVFAQIPRTISYQGILTDGAGNFIPDGNHSLTLKLYETASGGSAIYEESHAVAIIKGLFNAIIGSQTPLPASLSFDRAYYLGVTVDGGAELIPRMPLTAAPYALYAAVAGEARQLAAGATGAITSLQSNDATINITNPTGPLSDLSLANSAVTSAKIADTAVTLSKINTTGSQNGDVLTIDQGVATWRTAEGWKITGNAGTTDSNFIGTTDNTNLIFKTNNTEAMRIESGGLTRINSLLASNLNVPSGVINASNFRILYAEAFGNFFAGSYAGISNSGLYNTAIGTDALRLNTIGGGQTAVGYHALRSATTIGVSTAVGTRALSATTGSANVGLGYEAGLTNTTGSSNTFMGFRADAVSENLTNATAIGSGARVAASNAVVLGNNANVGIKTATPLSELHLGGKGTISLTERTDNPTGSITGVWQLYIYRFGSTYQLRVCAPNGELTNIGDLDH